MAPGAWGARAGELLERAAERRGASIHRIGGLAMLSPPDVSAGDWHCWIFGEPEDHGMLADRFGLASAGDLHHAFGRAIVALSEQACEALCGRFVLVAVDRERDRCVIVRDQLGAQPLNYASVADGGVLFAEHECDLLDLLPHTPRPDRLALLQWIENGLHPVGHTLYDGLSRLPAGHRLILGDGAAKVERWWKLRYAGVQQRSAEELAARVREAAFAAVGRATGEAARPAVKLSGGLDSACVAAGLAANGFANGRAIAMGSTFADYPDTDESELIEATARHTHLELEAIAFEQSSSMLTPALAHIARWRLPPATPNLFLWQPMMARARELGVDLMLDGEGGDELFALAPQLIADRLRAGRLRSAWSLAGSIPGMGPNPGPRVRLRRLRRFGAGPLVPGAVQRWREARVWPSAANALIPLADARTLAELHLAQRRDAPRRPLWWRSQLERQIDVRDELDMGGHFLRLAADDQVSRRHPFLYDLRLIETMLQIPPQAQFDPIRDRVLLRVGLAGLIPEAVRTRYAKSHFTPVVLDGIGSDEAGLIEPLRDATAPVRAYVVSEALDRKIGAAPTRRPMSQAGSLWRVGIANRWLLALEGEGQ